MEIIKLVAIFFAAYLLGSIPTAVWTGKLFHGIDVREHGSGNAGATNVIRVLGWKTGVPVLLIDMAKGWLAASLPVIFHLAPEGSSHLVNLQMLAGLCAVIGHIFPVFAGFRGGKGVAAITGVVLSIHPLVTLTCFLVFIIVLLVTGYVSVSSMTAGIVFPLSMFLFFDTPSPFFKVFALFVSVALIITHRKNIKRLLRGEESKFIRRGKSTKQSG
ncbi:MAG: glycerol-3-phosphate 1-O-acyltransferase PlsY [Bacteroidales bacterium]|jgi:glycerol-3-phosphate acyltransferase PlsY|nr:glycerol-3-phosphate 1-O-acyltransferase PlsY [Bacteroidales bacterium]